MFVMCFTSVEVDGASFRKTSETTKVLITDCKFEIDHSARNKCKVLCSFISTFVYGADS